MPTETEAQAKADYEAAHPGYRVNRVWTNQEGEVMADVSPPGAMVGNAQVVRIYHPYGIGVGEITGGYISPADIREYKEVTPYTEKANIIRQNEATIEAGHTYGTYTETVRGTLSPPYTGYKEETYITMRKPTLKMKAKAMANVVYGSMPLVYPNYLTTAERTETERAGPLRMQELGLLSQERARYDVGVKQREAERLKAAGFTVTTREVSQLYYKPYSAEEFAVAAYTSKFMPKWETPYSGLSPTGQKLLKNPIDRTVYDFARGFYTQVREHPLREMTLIVGGYGVTRGLTYAGQGIATAATATGVTKAIEKYPWASKVVKGIEVAGTAAVIGIPGYIAYKEIQAQPTTELRAYKAGQIGADLGAVSVGSYLSFTSAGYVSGLVKADVREVKGIVQGYKAYVPMSDMTRGELAAGGKGFPTAPPSQHIKEFQAGKYGLPNEYTLSGNPRYRTFAPYETGSEQPFINIQYAVGKSDSIIVPQGEYGGYFVKGFQASPTGWSKEFKVTGGKVRPKEMTGVYTASEVSPAFFRTREPSLIPSLELFPAMSTSPEVHRVTTMGGLKALPKAYKTNQYAFSVTAAQTEVAYAPLSKSEIEAVIAPTGTGLRQSAGKYFTQYPETWTGRFIPINEYQSFTYVPATTAVGKAAQSYKAAKTEVAAQEGSSVLKPYSASTLAGETYPLTRLKATSMVSAPKSSRALSSSIKSYSPPSSIAYTSRVSRSSTVSRPSYSGLSRSVTSASTTSEISVSEIPSISRISRGSTSKITEIKITTSEFLPSRLGRFKSSYSQAKPPRVLGKQTKRYQPTLTAIIGGVRGKEPKIGEVSGLGIRPLKTSGFKFKGGIF